MLEHSHTAPQNPQRVVILGAGGFFGQALCQQLDADSISNIGLKSADLDLCSDQAQDQLKALLKPTDSLVILSALTPDRGRGIDTFMKNLKMIENVCAVLTDLPLAQVVYFSSDAVYPLGSGLVSESSAAAPTDLYGVMHLSRELMLRQTSAKNLCILRPTMAYGPTDTHNSYGPNRFRRQAKAVGKIVIGGEGEETRDHIYVDDIASLTRLVLLHRSVGVLNLATGQSQDFATVARAVAGLFNEGEGETVQVCATPRNNAITHRSFDITALKQAFPGFTFTPTTTGLQLAHQGN